ncbi:MAG: potassium transporter TrkA [Sphingomonadales bacterium 28-64-96]|nr:MAG: potassium transporter TrkA [Sphingomonadales bacterium 28-64-96]
MTAAPPRTRDGGPLLRLPARLGVGTTLALRVVLVLALFGLAVGGHWWEREGLKDNIDGHISFSDVVYFTAITVTTVGYGDIVPASDAARMFDTFVVTPIRLFVWLIFLGTAYGFFFERGWQQVRTRMTQRKLNGHVVVCGYGTGGASAVEELIAQGLPCSQIVVVDKDSTRIEAACAQGVIGIAGDASHDEVLEAACIARAARVIVAPSRDDAAALIVLSARRLAPTARISVSVRTAENADLLHQAGADAIINPVLLGGQLLARAATNGHAVDYITDLAAARGRVALCERAVRADEVGQPLSSLTTGMGVRIIRAGKPIGWFDAAAQRLEAGDIVVEIVRADG